MSALLNSIDLTSMKMTTRCGENNHPEYDWSTTSLQERVIQFSFQTVRCDKTGIDKMELMLRKLLDDLQKFYSFNKISTTEYSETLTILYKLIGHTRDIVDGKGEYSHAYMHIFVWYSYFPELATYALKQFTKMDGKDIHPYGSWKDIKYFCNYCKSRKLDNTHPLMQYSFRLLNDQLLSDTNLSQPDDKVSLSGKWAPRESSNKFGWMFQELACLYFSHYLESAKTMESRTKAINKCKMDYRKVCSKLNKKLQTVQVNMCDGTWSVIDHSKTTSITISKQKRSFLNVNKDGSQRFELEDRVGCSENFKNRIKDVLISGVEIKGKRVSLNQMTDQAIELIERQNQIRQYECRDPYYQDQEHQPQPQDIENLQIEVDLLNSQWRDNGSTTGKLCNMIPMVDFSGSMDGEPQSCAYALGIRVAEKSIFGKRVLTFSESPKWHNLEDCSTFVEMVNSLQSGEVGYTTNFYKALNVILDSIVQSKMKPEEVDDLVVAIFSDMQINESGDNKYGNKSITDIDSMYQNIEKMYADAGIKVWGVPFKPPHILFWNLRSTDGFPCLSTQKNVSMMSGFNPALLNSFCSNGIESIQNYTPYNMLVEQLNNPRYECLGNKIKIELDKH